MTRSSILICVGLKFGSSTFTSTLPQIFRSIPILAAIAFIMSTAGATNAQTYSGQATAARVTTTVVAQPGVTVAVADTGELSSTGGNITLTSAGVNVPPPLTVGSSNVSAIGNGLATQSIASINNINIGLLSNAITATAVSATANAGCPSEVLSGSSTIAGLTINGLAIGVGTGPNQEIQILLLGQPIGVLRLNEQIITSRSITVNALHLIVTDPATLTVTDVVIGSARAGINCMVAPTESLYSGRGTGVSVNQIDVLTGDVTTFISDTGPLPTSGGSINTSMTGASILPPLVSTGVVTASTQGGTPVNQSDSHTSVDDLDISLLGGLVTVEAAVLDSNTMCTCSLGTPTCTGDSEIVDLTVTVLGSVINVPVTGIHQVFTIPVSIFGSITLTINGRESGTPADITAYPLRIQTSLAGLVATDITIARSHSDIVCGLPASATPVSVSGLVLDSEDRPVRGAVVTMTDMFGSTSSAVTNTFGSFTVSGLSAGSAYVVSTSARRFTFNDEVLEVNDNVTDHLILGAPQ